MYSVKGIIKVVVSIHQCNNLALSSFRIDLYLAVVQRGEFNLDTILSAL